MKVINESFNFLFKKCKTSGIYVNRYLFTYRKNHGINKNQHFGEILGKSETTAKRILIAKKIHEEEISSYS